MSVYHFTFSNLHSRMILTEYGDTPKFGDGYRCLTEILENTPHQFIFIITLAQWDGWKEVCKKYGWDEFVLYEMPYFVRNPNYKLPNHPEPRLRLVILKGQGTDEIN